MHSSRFVVRALIVSLVQSTTMQLSLATLVALAAASIASAQTLKPSGSPPTGCSSDYASSFEISVSLPLKKRDLEERQASCSTNGILVATLKGGVLTDSMGRIGGIVANHQFQFDGPPSQAGTIYNAGWSVCNNMSLALGSSAIFYQCLSGTFYNLYNTPAGASCEAIVITVIPCSSSSGATQASDGQPTAASAASQKSDGQPTVASATKGATQIGDGQVQATSAGKGATQISDGQVQASSAGKPVSQFTDGQIQVTASPVQATPVTQISDGQIQATSAKATSKAAVSQISDGQIQASASSTKAPVSQISDGQVQASASSTAAIGSSNATVTSSTPTTAAPATVSSALAPAMGVGAQIVLAVAGFAAAAML